MDRRLRNVFGRVVASSLWVKDEGPSFVYGFDPAKHEGFGMVNPADPCSRTGSRPISLHVADCLRPTQVPSVLDRARRGRFRADCRAALLEPNDGDTIAIRTTDFCYRTITDVHPRLVSLSATAVFEVAVAVIASR